MKLEYSVFKELSQAILEATNMNPDMTVEKIEVKQETQG